MSWDCNPYYSPEASSLSIVAEIDTAGSYEFDMVVVWRDAEGKLWAAADSGCSCPTPFDEISYPDGMQPVSRWEDVEPLVDRATEYNPSTDVPEFRSKVRQALAAKEKR